MKGGGFWFADTPPLRYHNRGVPIPPPIPPDGGGPSRIPPPPGGFLGSKRGFNPLIKMCTVFVVKMFIKFFGKNG